MLVKRRINENAIHLSAFFYVKKMEFLKESHKNY